MAKTVLVIQFVVLIFLNTSDCSRPTINQKVRKLNSTFQKIRKRLAEIENVTKEIEARRSDEIKNVKVFYEEKENFIKDTDKDKFKPVIIKYGGFYTDKRKLRLKENINAKMEIIGNITGESYNKKRLYVDVESQKLRNRTDDLLLEVRDGRPKEKEIFDNAQESLDKYSTLLTIDQLEKLQGKVSRLNDFVLFQQFSEFEKTRSTGTSGLKKIASLQVGARSYNSDDFCGKDGLAGISDELASTNNKVSFGPADFSLNGVAFRINGGGYELLQPKYNGQFGAMRPITIPQLLPDIKTSTIEKQIEIMRSYFQAFQNKAKDNDYVKYFKFYVSYVEGFWKSVEVDDIDELFQYCSETADPNHVCSSAEYLPTSTIRKEEGFDKVSQFKYNILAVPTYSGILKRIRLNKDLTSQKRLKMNNEEFERSNCARFTLNHYDEHGNEANEPMSYTYTDKVMSKVPGKDNFKSSNEGERKYSGSSLTSEEIFLHSDKSSLDQSYYHRSYKTKTGKDKQTCFSNQAYFAKTKQEEVAGPTYEGYQSAKASKAIPLEVLVISPLLKWNPYDLQEYSSCVEVTGDGTYENPYSGTCSNIFYRTPLTFFKDDTSNEQQLCTAYGGVFMKVNEVSKRCFLSSGTKVVLPKIDGVDGLVRLRYPIVPLTYEGNADWKKLKAVEKLFEYEINFAMGKSTVPFLPFHTHKVKIFRSEIDRLRNGDVIQKKTEGGPNVRHQHILTLKKDTDGTLKVTSCDSDEDEDTSNNLYCFDKHSESLTELPL